MSATPHDANDPGERVDPFSDPGELFDLYHSDGRLAGRVKRRADVHRDGDWHRSFHCWVTCLGPQPFPALESVPTPATGAASPLLILQRRGRYKDTWPGRLDASVGGHYRAGETLQDVMREVEEEIGQTARLEDLIPLGHRISVSEPPGAGRDRELQDVFLWRSPFPLAAFRPQPVEVHALEGVAVADLLGLWSGERDAIPVLALGTGDVIAPREVTREDFIPTFDRYFYRVAAVVDLALRGYPYLVI